MSYFFYNRIEEVRGQDLLDNGISIDAYRKPINPFVVYEIKINDKRKISQILSLEDSKKKKFFDFGQEVFNQGGIIKFVNASIRMGFSEDGSEYIWSLKEAIDCLVEIESYEKANYLKNELKKLELYIKNTKL